MYKSYIGLLAGLAFSILLVYLLIVVNFQSWLDPFLIISALPAALAGIVWFLFLTGTRLSVPALTGAIMCMGVATANSILVVSFAREQLEILVGDARQAALNAGFVRLRPVLMTALAMIIGMVPMALGLGDGGEQNAPLGRAVIGGLLLATVATLFFVPAFFSVVHGWLERRKKAHARGPGLCHRRIRRHNRSSLYDRTNPIRSRRKRKTTSPRREHEPHLAAQGPPRRHRGPASPPWCSPSPAFCPHLTPTPRLNKRTEAEAAPTVIALPAKPGAPVDSLRACPATSPPTPIRPSTRAPPAI